MFWSSPTIKRVAFRRQLAYRITTLVGFLLLFGVWSPRLAVTTQLWRLSDGWQWLLDLVVVLGFALSWWARAHLGNLWSSNITRKRDHALVETGPYALMRHPIYTGLIIAGFASAALLGTLVAMAGAILAALGWYLKARLEEEFLREELGAAAYDDYSGRAAMLIPFIRF